MEEYHMQKRKDCENLQTCIDKYLYKFRHLYIEQIDTNSTKVDIRLKYKTFDFIKNHDGMRLLIDHKEVFKFHFKEHYEGFSLKYEEKPKNALMIIAEDILSAFRWAYGSNQTIKKDPKNIRSVLSITIDNHLMRLSVDDMIKTLPYEYKGKTYHKII